MTIHDLPEGIVEHTGEITSLSFPRQGQTSVVAILETAGQKYVVKKTENELYNRWLAAEYDALVILSQTGLPVPKVYGYHAERNTRWLLMDYIDGVSLRAFLSGRQTTKARERAIANFGLALRNIHDCPCPLELAGNSQSWLDAMLLKAEYNLTHNKVDGSAELLAQLKWHRPAPIGNTLIHGDFTIDNVLVDSGGNIAGIIDWAGAAFGDPRYDAALAIRPKPYAFDNERDKEVFIDAYGKLTLSDEEYRYFADGVYEFF